MTREELKTKCEALAQSGDATAKATLELFAENAALKKLNDHAVYVLDKIAQTMALAVGLNIVDAVAKAPVTDRLNEEAVRNVRLGGPGSIGYKIAMQEAAGAGPSPEEVAAAATK